MVKEGMVDAVCAFASHVNMRGHLFQKVIFSNFILSLFTCTTPLNKWICIRIRRLRGPNLRTL